MSPFRLRDLPFWVYHSCQSGLGSLGLCSRRGADLWEALARVGILLAIGKGWSRFGVMEEGSTQMLSINRDLATITSAFRAPAVVEGVAEC